MIAYLTGHLSDKEQWTLLFAAVDLLDQAVAIMGGERFAFRTIYHQLVEQPYVDTYLNELLALTHVYHESPGLWARFARQIVNDVVQRGWLAANKPEGRLILSYLLYWWNAFARGYALEVEVEVYRDLQQSGIEFVAHDLRDPQQRYSPGDLVVRGLVGDIKTSTYFLQFAAPMSHDFYIVRLSIKGKRHTLVVFLQKPAWKTINGDTIDSSLDDIDQRLPHPVRIWHHGYELIVLDYTQWKQRILRQQGVTE